MIHIIYSIFVTALLAGMWLYMAVVMTGGCIDDWRETRRQRKDPNWP